MNLKQVYLDTVNYCKNKNFPLVDSVKYNLYSPEIKKLSDDILKNIYDTPKCLIIVENIDSLDMAEKLSLKIPFFDDSPSVLVLNMASNVKPGGGVEHGSKAQEEDLFRKTNYHEVLPSYMYKLKDNEVIISPLVHVIKDNFYQKLKNPFKVSCIAVAALRDPKLNFNHDDYKDSLDAELMQEKIDMIFKVAIIYKIRKLVLGALGCGVFNNPLKAVAYMFKNSILKYSNCFDTIAFAVLSGKHNDNFKVFKNILGDL